MPVLPYVSDLVNRGTSTARKMQASLYDWIVYQRRYKAKERKRRQVVLWVCSNIKKAAKALVASEPMVMWQNMAEVLYDPFVTCLQAHQVPPSSTKFHRFPPV